MVSAIVKYHQMDGRKEAHRVSVGMVLHIVCGRIHRRHPFHSLCARREADAHGVTLNAWYIYLYII